MKSVSLTLSLALTLLLAGGSAAAQVSVKNPWVRATVPAQTSTGAFMQITSTQDARLIEVRSPAAATVEVHQLAMSTNVMKMSPIAALPLPAGKPVTLGPGGYHVMMMDLKGQVKA